MNTDIFTNPIFIVVAILLLIVAIAFLVYYFRNRGKVKTLQEEYDKEKDALVEKYEADNAAERQEHEEKLSSINEKYHEETTLLNNKLSSLRQFTVDKGEYLTDLSLLQLKDRLVADEKIRETDMYILSNVYLPSRNYTNTRKIDHLVLTRTGIYLIDSKYWSGHILHGVNEENFEQLPYVEHFFDLLDIDKAKEQTLIFEKGNEQNVAVNHYNETIEETKISAEKLKNIFKLQYDVVPIIYFNPEDNGNYSIANYSNDPSIKVLVGEEELENFFMKYVFHGRFQYTVKDLDEIAEAIFQLNP
ncbi:nuclease-related domain-containing protein [Salinicoccus siamensis]|uniref:Nuclease-related domain-containing protein n=1 Tax=Salinicoccus siamensis TaxID=381830 RepID=A0ABV5Z3Z9_9STAP